MNRQPDGINQHQSGRKSPAAWHQQHIQFFLTRQQNIISYKFVVSSPPIVTWIDDLNQTNSCSSLKFLWETPKRKVKVRGGKQENLSYSQCLSFIRLDDLIMLQLDLPLRRARGLVEQVNAPHFSRLPPLPFHPPSSLRRPSPPSDSQRYSTIFFLAFFLRPFSSLPAGCSAASFYRPSWPSRGGKGSLQERRPPQRR